MTSDSKKIPNILPDGMLVRSEEVGFAESDLVPCPKCRRPNSPDRTGCIYCGSVLLNGDEALPKISEEVELEPWENGFNVAVRLRGEDVANVSRSYGFDSRILAAAVGNGELVFPVARIRSKVKAASIVQNLLEMRVESWMVPDADLAPDKPHIRLRAIDFDGDLCAFTEFNTGRRHIIPNEDIRLIVSGELSQSRTESTWKKKPKKDDRPNDTITDSSVSLIDIYTAADDFGFRVQMTGFDFSGLGDSKGMMAVENMRMLTVLLKDVSGACRFDSKYFLARPALDRVWELETQTDHLGLFAASFMAKEKTKVSVINNGRQFTKYSRLQRSSI